MAIWNFDNGHDVMKINGLNNNRPQNIINIINNQINEIKECAVKIPLAIHEKSQKIVNAKMEDR